MNINPNNNPMDYRDIIRLWHIQHTIHTIQLAEAFASYKSKEPKLIGSGVDHFVTSAIRIILGPTELEVHHRMCFYPADNPYDKIINGRMGKFENREQILRRVLLCEKISYDLMIKHLDELQHKVDVSRINSKKAIDALFSWSNGKVDDTNQGLTCWCLMHFWQMFSKSEYGRRKFDETMAQSEPAVERFVAWLKGAEFSCRDLTNCVPPILIPPLVSVVYDYLLAPDSATIMGAILDMIG